MHVHFLTYVYVEGNHADYNKYLKPQNVFQNSKLYYPCNLIVPLYIALQLNC